MKNPNRDPRSRQGRNRLLALVAAGAIIGGVVEVLPIDDGPNPLAQPAQETQKASLSAQMKAMMGGLIETAESSFLTVAPNNRDGEPLRRVTTNGLPDGQMIVISEISKDDSFGPSDITGFKVDLLAPGVTNEAQQAPVVTLSLDTTPGKESIDWGQTASKDAVAFHDTLTANGSLSNGQKSVQLSGQESSQALATLQQDMDSLINGQPISSSLPYPAN